MIPGARSVVWSVVRELAGLLLAPLVAVCVLVLLVATALVFLAEVVVGQFGEPEGD